MLDLSLHRISRLLKHTKQSWKAIHVAGTNGKGSICAYLSAMLHASNKSCGRFTSPHLIDRWDCITINEQPVAESVFREVETLVQERDQEEDVAATPFELLTATAFEIFERQRISYGVVEVGMGGSLDATNALKDKAVTVISKIGLDHQAYLGNTIEEIALHKAGIMRKGVSCVVDSSNQPSVLRAIESHAAKVQAEVVYPTLSATDTERLTNAKFEPHQVQNFACAQTAFQLACPNEDASLSRLLPIVQKISWPGRLQRLDNVSGIIGTKGPVLLDGAHNADSAKVLGAYVARHLRQDGRPVVWVLAMSEGKDVTEILGSLLQPEDEIYAVAFGPVDGMPWVNPAQPSVILAAASQSSLNEKQLHDCGSDLGLALRSASDRSTSCDGSLVIAGSLYLVSDVLRLARGHKAMKDN
jgi:dihydrofolate synthase